ncbi:MAG TPA: hypothetical protein VNT24_05960, partial [Propionibacteriaceae bacterium]|nr:hypothetical protein [Propionibacteriaceae bacterium]
PARPDPTHQSWRFGGRSRPVLLELGKPGTTGLPLILFQYPDNTKATYNLDTQLEIAAQPWVFATGAAYSMVEGAGVH